MKFSLSLLTWGLAALLLVSGCASNTSQSVRTVAQKQPAYQTPYAHDAGNGQNIASSRLQNQPLPPVMPVQAASGATPASSPFAPSQQLSTKIKVAILLPLTGRNAALGQAMLNAAQQAVFDSAASNFELVPHDTADGEGAEGAARAALRDGAQLIIGPLFAGDIPVVKMAAENANVQILPLSTDTSLTDHGVYIMGLAPAPQVDRVIAYAGAHGARHFAALVPDNAYGALVGHAFQLAVARAGGTVIDYESYDPATTESAERVRALAAQRDQIDALFLPESGADLKTIADQLAAAGFNPARTHMLGTGLWDVPGLGSQGALLNGGLYAAPDPALRRNFMIAYAQAYGQEPPRLATLAYDATALAAVLAKRGGRFDDAALTNPNGFAGLDGIFRLQPSGAVERALAVNMVTADQARVVDPAPTSFVGKNR